MLSPRFTRSRGRKKNVFFSSPNRNRLTPTTTRWQHTNRTNLLSTTAIIDSDVNSENSPSLGSDSARLDFAAGLSAVNTDSQPDSASTVAPLLSPTIRHKALKQLFLLMEKDTDLQCQWWTLESITKIVNRLNSLCVATRLEQDEGSPVLTPKAAVERLLQRMSCTVQYSMLEF